MGIPAQHRSRLSTACALVGVALLGLSAIGCGKKAPPAAQTPTVSTGPLTIWHSDFRAETVEGLAAGNSTENTTIKARKFEWPVYEWRSLNGIAADSAPDVWIIPNDWLQDHRDKLVTLPADYIKPGEDGKGPANTADYFKTSHLPLFTEQLLNEEGTAVGFPGPVKELKLFINRRLFGEASERWREIKKGSPVNEYETIRKILGSPIVTWNDLAYSSQLITRRNGNSIVISGAALGMAKNIPWAQDIFELMTYQYGGQIVDSTKLISLFQNYEKSPEGELTYPGKDAMRYYTSFSDPNNPNFSWSADMPDAREAFLQGKVAMMFDYGEFEDVVKQRARGVVDLEVANVPQLTADGEMVTFLRYYIIGISKGSQKKTKAGLMARRLSEDNTLSKGLPRSYSPMLKHSTESKARIDAGKTVFKKHHADFDSIMNEMIDDVALRGQSPDNAVDRGAEKINQLLDRDE